MQRPIPLTPTTIAAIEASQSADRLATYYRLASGDKVRGLELYAWNTALCEAFYPCLQALEVTLRTALARRLVAGWGASWFQGSLPLEYVQHQQLAAALQDVARSKRATSGPDVVASLTFGFWAGLLGRKYENSLWRQHFRPLFRPQTGKLLRSEVHRIVDGARVLRNRIAHLELILAADDLLARHDEYVRLVGWICPATADWVRSLSRLAEVWAWPQNPHAP